MHSLLENYLLEMAAQLSALPPPRRNEELREMRVHLENAIEAYQELGETEQEAVASTLRQFGAPSQVAAGLVRARRREHGSGLDTAKAGLFSVAALWSVDGICRCLGHYLEGHPDVFGMLRLHFEPVFYTLIFGLPVLLGGLTSGLTVRGAVKGVVWGTGLGYVGPMVVDEVIHAWNDSDILGTALIVLLQAAGLTGAAWVGSRWRKAHHAQPA